MMILILDINECHQDQNICLPPGNCVNTLGSYRCSCPKPYKLDPSSNRCVDPKHTKNNQTDCFGIDCDPFGGCTNRLVNLFDLSI